MRISDWSSDVCSSDLLEQIVRAIFEEFEDAHKLASGDRKAGRILKVVLYGSIARGEGIYEPQTAKGYVSDYDILVIVNQDELAEQIGRASCWERVWQYV